MPSMFWSRDCASRTNRSRSPRTITHAPTNETSDQPVRSRLRATTSQRPRHVQICSPASAPEQRRTEAPAGELAGDRGERTEVPIGAARQGHHVNVRGPRLCARTESAMSAVRIERDGGPSRNRGLVQ